MVDEVYTQNMWIGHFVLLFFLCMIEASKVDHSASYVVGCWWLRAAVFVSAASTPHLGAFEAPFQTTVDNKILVRSRRGKERDSNLRGIRNGM